MAVASPPVPPTIHNSGFGRFFCCGGGHTLFNAWCDCQSSELDMPSLPIWVYLRYTSLVFVGVLFPLSAVNLALSLSISPLSWIFISPPTYHIINMNTHTHRGKHVELSSSSGPIVIASTCKLLFTLRASDCRESVITTHSSKPNSHFRGVVVYPYKPILSINLWLSCP